VWWGKKCCEEREKAFLASLVLPGKMAALFDCFVGVDFKHAQYDLGGGDGSSVGVSLSRPTYPALFYTENRDRIWLFLQSHAHPLEAMGANTPFGPQAPWPEPPPPPDGPCTDKAMPDGGYPNQMPPCHSKPLGASNGHRLTCLCLEDCLGQGVRRGGDPGVQEKGADIYTRKHTRRNVRHIFFQYRALHVLGHLQ
jgi:hypothetical protein